MLEQIDLGADVHAFQALCHGHPPVGAEINGRHPRELRVKAGGAHVTAGGQPETKSVRESGNGGRGS